MDCLGVRSIRKLVQHVMQPFWDLQHINQDMQENQEKIVQDANYRKTDIHN